MKYKAGDRVRIKSIDWYNENKNDINYVSLTIDSYNVIDFTEPMAVFCGKVMTIAGIRRGFYYMLEDSGMYSWIDEMIEGFAEEKTKPKDMKEEWCCPEGYIFKDENGNVINATKIILEKKKKEYPKTYEECAKVLLDRASVRNDIGYKGGLLVALQKLLVCRDAYWKIAGEEMGLGKPWEPDWKNSEEKRYSIVNIEGDINLPEKILTKWILKVTNKILVFPTEKMRDAFYENFKELIESCKELL